jgi:hypothetical protein
MTSSHLPSGDLSVLSTTDRRTLEALFRHPVAHNLAWGDVLGLFQRGGSAVETLHDSFELAIGDAKENFHRPRDKQLSGEEVTRLRHFVTRSGWLAGSKDSPAADRAAHDLLVVVEHHQARLWRIDIAGADKTSRVIEPYDPHHFLHHLEHRDQLHEQGQRAPEEPAWYAEIAAALSGAGRIVVIGHGTGHSNAAHHLTAYLRRLHTETAAHVVGCLTADLSALTPPELLDLASRAIDEAASRPADRAAS